MEHGTKAGASSQQWLATEPAYTTCPPTESPGPGLAARHQPGTPAAQRDQLRTPSHHISRVAFGPNFLSSRGVQCGVLRKGVLFALLRPSRTRSADARVSPRRRASCAI